MGISRRTFLDTAALGGLAGRVALAAGVDGATGMPTRVLGKTGARVSILGFGGGSRFLAYGEEDKGLAALNLALDHGVSYIDSAFNYGKGQSEEWVGKLMKTRRKEVWLVTKIADRQADEVMRTFEGSLKRLQTDHVDLLHVHGLGDAADLAAIEAPGGALEAFYKLRDEKAARFIGVTCHDDATVLKKALERHDFDCVQMALNAARVGSGSGAKRGAPDSFETLALPVALRKKMGVTAMKIFSQDKIAGEAPAEQLIRYVMSLPIASAVIGMPTLGVLKEDIRIARAFKPMPAAEMRDLAERLSRTHKAILDAFFRRHEDA